MRVVSSGGATHSNQFEGPPLVVAGTAVDLGEAARAVERHGDRVRRVDFDLEGSLDPEGMADEGGADTAPAGLGEDEKPADEVPQEAEKPRGVPFSAATQVSAFGK